MGTGVGVDVGMGVLVGAGVGVAVGMGVLVGAGTGVAVGMGVLVGAGTGVGVGMGVLVGAGAVPAALAARAGADCALPASAVSWRDPPAGRLAGSAGGHSVSYGSASQRSTSASNVLPTESEAARISPSSDPSSDSNPPSRPESPDNSDSNLPTLRAKSPSASPIIGVSEPALSALSRSPTASVASDTKPFTSRTEPSRSDAASAASPNSVSISSPDTDDGSTPRIRSDALVRDAALSPSAFSSESRERMRSSASSTPENDSRTTSMADMLPSKGMRAFMPSSSSNM